jgi:hypothetical protein
MFKQNIWKKKHSNIGVKAVVSARVAAAKTLTKNEALSLRQ